MTAPAGYRTCRDCGGIFPAYEVDPLVEAPGLGLNRRCATCHDEFRKKPHGNKGRKHTAETRKRISQSVKSARGNPASWENFTTWSALGETWAGKGTGGES